MTVYDTANGAAYRVGDTYFLADVMHLVLQRIRQSRSARLRSRFGLWDVEAQHFIGNGTPMKLNRDW